MIGMLQGEIDVLDAPCLFLNVNGVGYKVLVSERLLVKVSVGQKIKLFTYTHVREEILDLIGFLTFEELKLFENLISVSGIGPKTGINIFSFGSYEEIVNAIVKGDVEFFTAIPRLGRKNAQKIIIELKNKFGAIVELDLSEKDIKENGEIIKALKGFGFSLREATDAIRATRGVGKTVEEKIRLALKELGK